MTTMIAGVKADTTIQHTSLLSHLGLMAGKHLALCGPGIGAKENEDDQQKGYESLHRRYLAISGANIQCAPLFSSPQRHGEHREHFFNIARKPLCTLCLCGE